MGETDDVDPPQQKETNGSTETAPAEDSKETDKLLTDEKKAELTKTEGEVKPEEPKKLNGEEIINIPEEAATEKKDSEETQEPKKKVNAEEREVKPKKIPIGGIKMPGFFTRNKDKSKSDGDGAEHELLEKGEKEEKPKEVEEQEKKPGLLDNIRDRFGALFSRKPPTAQETTAENGTAAAGEENQENQENEKKAEETKSTDGDTAETTKPAEENPPAEATTSKKNLLGSIKLPTLGNIIPKRLKRSNQDDIELGNGPNNRAGLASMETLDDSQKDNGDTTKDTVDKAGVGATNSSDETKMETIKLNEDKEAEKAAEAEQDRPPKAALVDRIRAYRCSVDDLAIIGGIVLFVILVICILLFALSGSPSAKTAPIRDGKYVEAVTSCGNVEGLLEDSSFAFRGIPYAVPPIDENRWRPAVLIDNIDYCWNGTFKAHNATPHCWQMYSNNSLNGVEDCLTLDVITPHIRYDNPLPVVVLIGADSFTGDSPGNLRPSARYARSRDVIFVRPNFRLGVLGFLALKPLSDSSHPPTSGNYALTDIIAALKWIQLNIVHFGGDPKSVTLFGHRAGATIVTALISSNKTKNLYQRAWISSGAARFQGRSLIESEKDNIKFLGKIDCQDADCLRNKEDETLLDATPDEWRHVTPELPRPGEDMAKPHEWLVLDGDILTQHPSDVWKASGFTAPKMVIGTTIHESHSSTLLLKYANWTSELVRKHVEESQIGAKGLTDKVFEKYNDTYQGLVSMISDIRTICPLLELHRAIPSSTFYIVTQTGGPQSLADVDADVQAIFGRYEPKTVEQRRYLSSMQQVFFHFVSHGTVPQTDDKRKKILEIGQDPLVKDNWSACEFWIANDFVPRYARLD